MNVELKKYHDETGSSLGKGEKLKLVKDITKAKFAEESQQIKDDIALKKSTQPNPNAQALQTDLAVRTPEQLLR